MERCSLGEYRSASRIVPPGIMQVSASFLCSLLSRKNVERVAVAPSTHGWLFQTGELASYGPRQQRWHQVDPSGIRWPQNKHTSLVRMSLISLSSAKIRWSTCDIRAESSSSSP